MAKPSDMVSIYELTDPRNGEIRYVGMTADLTSRLLMHKRKGSSRVKPWIDEMLKEAGASPNIREIEQVPYSERNRRERYWIARRIAEGHDLLNIVSLPLPASAPGQYAPCPEPMLTSSQVSEIRALLAAGRAPKEIAETLGFKARTTFLYALSQAGYRIKSSRVLNPITPVRPEGAENA